MSMDRHGGTRLPDDPEYWEALAARAVRAALRGPTVLRTAAAAEPWWRAMSDAAFVLAASAVLALLGGGLLPGVRGEAPREARALTNVLAPDEPLLGSLVSETAGPPPASALLRLMALRERER